MNRNHANPANRDPLLPGNPWRASLAFALVAMLFFGFAYSLAATGLGRILFPAQATGSLLEREGRIVGSALVAQPFSDARYFQPRPSAANFDMMALSGSNQARTNPELRLRIDTTRAAVALRNGIRPEDVPDDLVTQSASGVDPHISPEAARIQATNVATARGLDPGVVNQLVESHIEKPQFGIFGRDRVNVLELNLALDGMRGSGGAE